MIRIQYKLQWESTIKEHCGIKSLVKAQNVHKNQLNKPKFREIEREVLLLYVKRCKC